MDLNTIWFVLIIVLLAGYSISDGYDLGVGILHLAAEDDSERKGNMTAIGPVWDGNEVWLLVATGSIFAAFPPVYATLLSAFYPLFVLLLISLIFRAISLEVRNKFSSRGWHRFWDYSFGGGSLLASLLFGIVLGNILTGMSINSDGDYVGTLGSLLTLYPFLISALVSSFFVMHGAIYMMTKSAEEQTLRYRRYFFAAWVVVMSLYPAAVISTLYVSPLLLEGLLRYPVAWITLVIPFVVNLYIPVAVKKNRYYQAFITSSIMISCSVALIGIFLFPVILPSSIDPAYSLTIYSAASGPLSLKIILLIALITLPFVIAYTLLIHRVFKGKVSLSEKDHY